MRIHQLNQKCSLDSVPLGPLDCHNQTLTPNPDDESEVWESSSYDDPHIYVWSMLDPMAPKLKEQLSLRSQWGSHWLTFDLKGDYAYLAPAKNSDDATEIFNAHTHTSVGLISSSEDMIEIDFTNGKISGVGDQYGIGRVARD